MSLPAIFGRKGHPSPAPVRDLTPIIKRAVLQVKAMPDTRARAEAVALLRHVDVEWREAISLSAAARDATLRDLRARLQRLTDQVVSGEATRSSTARAAAHADVERARQKRRAQALKDIDDPNARWAAENP